MGIDLNSIRTDYGLAGLSETDLPPSPIEAIEKWLHEAIAAKHPEPNAMTLATIDDRGDPAARVVLLRGLDARGLVFFTNYDSNKGRDLAARPRASVCIHWVQLERQVRVTGDVAKVTREENEAYFRSRPRETQLGAWASPQSAVLSGREELERRLLETRARFGDGEVPCPPYWGGYRLAPDRVELWQGRPSRLHDRLQYTRIGERAWRVDRLSP